MSSYYESADLKKFGEIGRHAKQLADDFFKYYGDVTGTDGALSKREKALIARGHPRRQGPLCWRHLKLTRNLRKAIVRERKPLLQPLTEWANVRRCCGAAGTAAVCRCAPGGNLVGAELRSSSD